MINSVSVASSLKRARSSPAAVNPATESLRPAAQKQGVRKDPSVFCSCNTQAALRSTRTPPCKAALPRVDHLHTHPHAAYMLKQACTDPPAPRHAHTHPRSDTHSVTRTQVCAVHTCDPCSQVCVHTRTQAQPHSVRAPSASIPTWTPSCVQMRALVGDAEHSPSAHASHWVLRVRKSTGDGQPQSLIPRLRGGAGPGHACRPGTSWELLVPPHGALLGSFLAGHLLKWALSSPVSGNRGCA